MMILSTRSLPGSGTIKLSEIKAEFGKGNNLLDYLGEGGVTSSAPLKMTDFYGASSSIDLLKSNPEVRRLSGVHYPSLLTPDSTTWYQGIQTAIQDNVRGDAKSACTLSNSSHQMISSKTYKVEFEISTDPGGSHRLHQFAVRLGKFTGSYSTTPKFGTTYPAGVEDPLASNMTTLYENKLENWGTNGGQRDTGRVNKDNSMIIPTTANGTLVSGNADSLNSGMDNPVHFRSSISSWSPGFTGPLAVVYECNNDWEEIAVNYQKFTLRKLSITEN